jgi:metal-responsive CopG/Arc/MetJ family transcriptional regulator
MKTAISVPDEMFKEIEKVAKERRSSRSEVFVTAVREYLERRRSGRLLDAINDASAAAETAEEYQVRHKSKKNYVRNVLKKERS